MSGYYYGSSEDTTPEPVYTPGTDDNMDPDRSYNATHASEGYHTGMPYQNHFAGSWSAGNVTILNTSQVYLNTQGTFPNAGMATANFSNSYYLTPQPQFPPDWDMPDQSRGYSHQDRPNVTSHPWTGDVPNTTFDHSNSRTARVLPINTLRDIKINLESSLVQYRDRKIECSLPDAAGENKHPIPIRMLDTLSKSLAGYMMLHDSEEYIPHSLSSSALLTELTALEMSFKDHLKAHRGGPSEDGCAPVCENIRKSVSKDLNKLKEGRG